MTNAILLIIGIILLLISTNKLLTLTTKLAYSLRMSPLIIGITVIAIGTSLPEFVVSSLASIHGDYGLAIGNVLGSNIVNILIVLSLGILGGNLRVGTTKTQKNAFLLAVASFLYLISFWMNIPGIIKSVGFISLALIFTVTQYQWGKSGRKLEDRIMFKLTKKSKVTYREYIFIIFCLILVFIGGSLVVSSVEQIAIITGYSTNILGLSLTAIATSLPEIMATIIGIRQNEDKLLLGNIIGSNIYNILLIGGIPYLWIKNYSPPNFEIIFFTLSLFIFLAIIHFYKGKIIPRFIGLGMLLISFFYFGVMYL